MHNTCNTSDDEEEVQENYGNYTFMQLVWVVKVALDEVVQFNCSFDDLHEMHLQYLAMELRAYYHFVVLKRPEEVPWVRFEIDTVFTYFRYLRPIIDGQEDPHGFEGIRGLHDRMRSDLRGLLPEHLPPMGYDDRAYPENRNDSSQSDEVSGQEDNEVEQVEEDDGDDDEVEEEEEDEEEEEEADSSIWDDVEREP